MRKPSDTPAGRPPRTAHATPIGPLIARSISPRCRRCGYSLKGLRWDFAHAICPECGLAGPPDEVVIEAAEPLPWIYRLLLITGPMTGCFVITFVLAMLDIGAGFGVLLVFAGGCAGVFAPVTMASYSMDREPNTIRRPLVFCLTLTGGWILNFTIAVAIIYALGKMAF